MRRLLRWPAAVSRSDHPHLNPPPSSGKRSEGEAVAALACGGEEVRSPSPRSSAIKGEEGTRFWGPAAGATTTVRDSTQSPLP